MRPSAKVKSDLALEVRFNPDGADAIGRLRAEHKAARASEYLSRLVSEAPELSQDQLDELASILSTAYDETPQDDDAALAALRQVADRDTVRSFKETFLTCMVIRAVRRTPRTPRRRAVVSILTLAAGLAGVHWHAWSILVHFVH